MSKTASKVTADTYRSPLSAAADATEFSVCWLNEIRHGITGTAGMNSLKTDGGKAETARHERL